MLFRHSRYIATALLTACCAYTTAGLAEELFRPGAVATGSGYVQVFNEDTNQEGMLYYEIIDDMMIHEGDIVLGPVVTPGDGYGPFGVGYINVGKRWVDGLVPYVFDASITDRHKTTILQAIEYLTSITSIRFVERTTEKDYVSFYNGSGCSSNVGRAGGKQSISLHHGDGTTCLRKGIVSHEILHALGIKHEQSRIDRDKHVIIHYGNIEAGKERQFDVADDTLFEDIGVYDYGSVMHYAATAFGSPKGAITIETKVPAIIGQRDGLSATDIATVQYLYSVNLGLSGTAPASIATNSSFNLDLSVANQGVATLGHVIARQLVVTTSLPAGISYDSASSSDDWHCSASASSVTCELAELDRRASSDLQLKLKAGSSLGASANFDVELTAQNHDEDETDNLLKLTASTGGGAEVKDNLSLTNSVSPSSIQLDQTTTYTATVKNKLATAASSVTLVANVPASLSYQNFSGSAWSCAGSSTIKCVRSGSLSGNSSSSVSLVLKAVSVGNAQTISAGVSSAQADADSSDNSSSAKLDILPISVSDLSVVTGVSSSTIAVGETTTLNAKVTNKRAETASNIELQLSFPAGLSYQSHSAAGWSCVSSGGLKCTRSSLSASGDSSMTVKLKAISVGSNQAINASVKTALTDEVPADNSSSSKVTVTAAPPTSSDLSLSSSVSASTVVLDQEVTLTAVVKNKLAETAEDLQLNIGLPAGLSYQRVTASGWICSNAAGLQCNRTSLTGAASSTLNFVLKAIDVGNDQTINASVKASLTDEVPGDNTSSSKVTVTAAPPVNSDLSLSTSVNPRLVSLGGEVTLTTTVKNKLSETANSLQLDIVLPAGLSYKRVIGSGWNCFTSATGLKCTRINLTGTASSTLNFVLEAGVVGNDQIITVSVKDALTDATPADNASRQSVSVQGGTLPDPVDMSVTLAATPHELELGDALAVTVDVHNGASLVAKSLLLEISYPASLDYQPGSLVGWSCVDHGGSLRCERSSFPATSAQRLAFRFVAAAVSSEARLVAHITSAVTDDHEDNNRSSVAVVINDLEPVEPPKTGGGSKSGDSESGGAGAAGLNLLALLGLMLLWRRSRFA